jgi:hypothetical protein
MDTIIAKNIKGQTFDTPTFFERCNVIECVFNVGCSFVRCNVIDCENTDICSFVESNNINTADETDDLDIDN